MDFTIREIGGTIARAVNGRTRVVGRAADRGFQWSAVAGLQDLGVAVSGADGGAFDINDANQIVGVHLDGNGNHRGFLWDAGTLHELNPVQNDSGCAARAINERRLIVGWSGTTPLLDTRAVMWNGGNPAQPLGLAGVVASVANDINEDRQVVGAFTTGREFQQPVFQRETVAFLSKDGTTFAIGDLFPPECHFSEALAVNNKGEVVGTSVRYDIQPGRVFIRAFFWSPNDPRHIQELPTLSGLIAADVEALDINDSGQIVGTGDIHAEQRARAVMWSNGQIIDLNTFVPARFDGNGQRLPSEWFLKIATGINNWGQIVGIGEHNGAPTCFLMSPVRVIPEPTLVVEYVSRVLIGVVAGSRGWVLPLGGGPIPVDPDPIWQALSPTVQDIQVGLLIHETAKLLNNVQSRCEVQKLALRQIADRARVGEIPLECSDFEE